MSKNSVGILIAIIVIVAITGIIIAANKPSATETPTPSPSASVTPVTVTPAASTSMSTSVKSYTIAEVALHATAASCWTTISGKVYDLTAFIPNHPGGDKILKVCGKDGTSIFTNQHGGQPNPMAALEKQQIGVLAQ